MKNAFDAARTLGQLVAEFRAGSEEAFETLYSRFQKPIHRYVATRIQHPELVEEVTQDIFLKVHRARDSYQPEFAFTTWLWTIARNTVFDHLRGSRNALLEHSEGELGPDGEDEAACRRQDAEALILKSDQRRHLFRVARSLTRLQRKVLWYRLVHHLSFQEVAAKLGLSLASVKNLAYRARMTLSGEFGQLPAFA